MTNLTNVKVRISEGQQDKLKKAFDSNCESITISLTFTDLHGEDVIALTKITIWQTSEGIRSKEKCQKHNWLTT